MQVQKNNYFTYQVALIALPLLLYICMCVAVIFICKRKNVSIEIFFYIKLFTGSTSCLYATQKSLFVVWFSILFRVFIYHHCIYSISNIINDENIKSVVNNKVFMKRSKEIEKNVKCNWSFEFNLVIDW